MPKLKLENKFLLKLGITRLTYLKCLLPSGSTAFWAVEPLFSTGKRIIHKSFK
jgi:hypothetical protein